MPIEDFSLPTALFSGDMDGLATPEEVTWLSAQLGDNVVFQKQYHMDHFTFILGKDMKFFSEDAVAQLHKFNPVTNFESFLAN